MFSQGTSAATLQGMLVDFKISQIVALGLQEAGLRHTLASHGCCARGTPAGR